MNHSVLLLGASGQVGVEFLRLHGRAGVIAPTRAELDLADAEAVGKAVRMAQPKWIVNAAAYTAVDRAEQEPELAYAVNAGAVGALADAAASIGAPVVHFSTDYVFDGAGPAPRIEADPTGPLGVYGASKLAGEQALLGSGAVSFLFRTSWVYSSHGKNFMLTMLKLAREREEVRVVEDQRGSPTAARDLAGCVVHAMQRAEGLAVREKCSLQEAAAAFGGLYHTSNAGETTWFGFAEEILRIARERDPGSYKARLTPISTAEYPTPARRPADSRLDCALLRERLGFRMPDWKTSLAITAEEHLKTASLSNVQANLCAGMGQEG